MSKMIVLLFCHFAFATIDLNFAELEYLADHLLPEECRRLVAAAHFKSYQEPNALGQAERAISKDIPCIQLLLHWNSAKGEGRGETHEVLEHRLRQMGKIELADWLGRTVFHQLGEDLEKELLGGLKEFVNESVPKTRNIPQPTLYPPQRVGDPMGWLPFDSICLALISFLIGAIFCLCCFLVYRTIRMKYRLKKEKISENYEMVAETSSESENKFDIREHETAM